MKSLTSGLWEFLLVLSIGIVTAGGLFLREIENDIKDGGEAFSRKAAISLCVKLFGCSIGALWAASVASAAGICDWQFVFAGIGGKLGWELLDAVAKVVLVSIPDMLNILKNTFNKK